MAKIYTDEEMQKYSQNPHVLYICRDMLVLTLEFRKELYDGWKECRVPAVIKGLLEADGFDTASMDRSCWCSLSDAFKKYGRPTTSSHRGINREDTVYGAGWQKEMASARDEAAPEEIKAEKERLVNTGRFIYTNRGIKLSPQFEEELFREYPQKDIRQGLEDAGFGRHVVSSYQIKKLEKTFLERLGLADEKKKAGAGIQPENVESGFPEEKVNAEERTRSLGQNPAVEKVTKTTVRFRQWFYDSAAVLGTLAVDEILQVFLIDPAMLTEKEKSAIRKRVFMTLPGGWDASMSGDTFFDAAFLSRRKAALEKVIDEGNSQLAESYRGLSPARKKEVCLWISSLPADPQHKYTLGNILESIGITRSVYYRYVKEEGFGLGAERKKEAESHDVEDVRKAFEYKGFRKGSRQVCMLLPRLTGRRMGLKKVRRIMNRNGMDAGIRRPNKARQKAQENLEETVKPDLLRRAFRLHRPNEVRVTDVTYLDYGDGLRAYGSALMDPVTGRLITFYVSEHNDLELALETLRRSDSHPCEDGGIFHSDQGCLYRAGQFQKEVLDRGYRQSMSKRGNCWDNATQESFFGHFKDECDYTSCRDVEELRKKVAQYEYYYDNERGMWDRGRMTPVEYERYLLSLDEEEWGRYLAVEEEKYQKMKERAAALAKKRYGTLGV